MWKIKVRSWPLNVLQMSWAGHMPRRFQPGYRRFYVHLELEPFQLVFLHLWTWSPNQHPVHPTTDCNCIHACVWKHPSKGGYSHVQEFLIYIIYIFIYIYITHAHTHIPFFHVVWPGTLVRIPFVHSIMTCSIFLDSYVIIVGGIVRLLAQSSCWLLMLGGNWCHHTRKRRLPWCGDACKGSLSCAHSSYSHGILQYRGSSLHCLCTFAGIVASN